jgi:hypothetical protein
MTLVCPCPSTAGDDARAVARARQDAASVDGDALLAPALRRQQHRLLGQREHGGLAEEMGADHRGAGGHRPGAVDDGRGFAGLGHG